MQDHVVSQITLINGEKIWVREEKGPSWNHNSSAGSSHGSIGSTTSSTHDDCNSSTDSINICVGLPLLVSTSNQVAELDLSADMMDLSSLFNSTGRVCKNPKISETRPEPENRGISGFGSNNSNSNYTQTRPDLNPHSLAKLLTRKITYKFCMSF